jgi:hypothetical protein
MNNTDTIDFASFDVSELAVLEVADAIGLPEMGASISLYVPDMEDMIGDVASGATAGCCSCSSTCCC